MKTSPTIDSRFMQLVAVLEECEVRHGGCQGCGQAERCIKEFDLLSEYAGDKPLTQGQFRDYKTRVVMLTSQLTLMN